MSVTGGGQNLGTATFYIVGDASGATTAANQANNALAGLSKSVRANSAGLNTLGIAFGILPGAITAGLGAAVGAFSSLQNQFLAVQQQTGDFSNDIGGLKDQILQLAKTIPFAISAITEMVATGANIGIAKDQLVEFSKNMLVLTDVTNAGVAGVQDLAKVMENFSVPTDQIQGLTNTVIELDRHSPSTAKDIITVTKSLSGLGAAAGLTANQTLAFGTAITETGVRSEAGATAFGVVIQKFAAAVSGGDKAIAKFATTAGLNVDKFAKDAKTNMGAAIEDLVNSLSKLDGAAKMQALKDLGITSSRAQRAILALTEANSGNAEGLSRLSELLQDVDGKYKNSTAAQDALNAKSKTLSGQMIELRNTVEEFLASIGAGSAGPLTFFISQIENFLAGFEALPGPLKIVAALSTGFIALVLGLASAFLLLGPQVLRAVEAYRVFSQIQIGARASTEELTVANETLAESAATTSVVIDEEVQALSALGGEAAAAALELSGLSGSQATAAIGGIGASATEAAGGIGGLGAAAAGAAPEIGEVATAGLGLGEIASGVGIPLGIATLAMVALGIASAVTGHHAREQAAAAQASIGPNAELTARMKDQGAAVGALSNRFIQSLPSYRAVRELADSLRIHLSVLNDIINNVSTGSEFAQLTDAIDHADKKTLQNIQTVLRLAKTQAASANAAGFGAKAAGGLGDAQDKAAESAAKLNKQLQEQYDKLSAQAQAFTDLVNAQDSASKAQESLTKAQKALDAALADAGSQADQVAKAELSLTDAQDAQALAAQRVTEAEIALATARSDAAEKVHDAELDLADAQSKVIDSNEKIAKLTKDLSDLQQGSAASVLEIAKATDKLHDAQLKLTASTRKVADAQFQLKKLQEDGAAARDIADAQQALAEAQQSVADGTTDIADAQKTLDDLTDPVKRAQDISDAERALQDAERDSERAIEDVTKKTKDLATLRDRVAKDVDYINAQKDLTDAQLGVIQSDKDVQKAEKDLADARSSAPIQAVVDAQDNLYDAILNVAKANVEVQKQTALAAGKTWDAHDAAQALAGQLANLIELAPTAANIDALQKYVDLLNAAPVVPPKPSSDTGDSGGGAGGGAGGVDIPSLTPKEIDDALDRAQKALDSTSKKKPVHLHLGPVTITASNGSFEGIGINVVKAIIHGMESAAGDVKRFFERMWNDAIGFVKTLLGIHSPSTVFAGIGSDVLQGLFNGLTGGVGGVIGFFTSLPSRMLGALGGLGGLLLGVGADLIHGLYTGATNFFSNNVIPFIQGLPGNVASGFVGVRDALFHTGRQLLNGLLDGISDFFKKEFKAGWNAILDAVPGHFLDKFEMHSPSKLFFRFGRNIMAGLTNGLNEESDQTLRAMQQISSGIIDAATPDSSDLGKTLIDSIIEQMESQFTDLEKTMAEVNGIIQGGVSGDFLKSLVTDINQVRNAFAGTAAGAGLSAQAPGGSTIVNNQEVLQLQAITTADPAAILNEYTWVKRIRLRGGSK